MPVGPRDYDISSSTDGYGRDNPDTAHGSIKHLKGLDWRRERDSNPRYGVNPYNALAGRPLRPLGHLSGRAAHYITRVRASFPCQPGWSSPNALCSARTASSMYFSSITTEILISEVEIIWMLMPSSARVRNILLAMPAWVRMPTPTMDTLQILSSPRISAALMWSLTWLLRTSSAF